MTKISLMQAAKAADAAWMAEVVATFGARDAGMVRFQARANGEPGTKLRELYDAYVSARDAYASVKERRPTCVGGIQRHPERHAPNAVDVSGRRTIEQRSAKRGARFFI